VDHEALETRLELFRSAALWENVMQVEIKNIETPEFKDAIVRALAGSVVGDVVLAMMRNAATDYQVKRSIEDAVRDHVGRHARTIIAENVEFQAMVKAKVEELLNESLLNDLVHESRSTVTENNRALVLRSHFWGSCEVSKDPDDFGAFLEKTVAADPELSEAVAVAEKELEAEGIKQRLADAEWLLYRLARHIRNNDKLQPIPWGIAGIDLLMDVRDYAPDRYDMDVKWY